MIGLLGGTFDPIHDGHLRTALDCQQALGLREVRLIPLRVAVHRPQPSATPEQRLAMVEAAIAGQPGFVADDRELRRAGGSFTHDTLVSLRAELGPEPPLCWLAGADAFAGFLGWHRPLAILDLAHLVVLCRPRHGPIRDPELRALAESRRARTAAELRAHPGGRILFQEVTRLDIAATRIRRLIGAGQSPRWLLPDPVLAIVERERLYRQR